MVLILRIGIAAMQVLYFFCKWGKTQNKVLFLSRQSNTIPPEYEMLIEELKYVDCTQVVMCKTIDAGFVSKIRYCFWMLRCMAQLATAKVCITDGYSIPVCVLKHKDTLKIIQLWHAVGAVKKFGYQIIDEPEGSGMKMARAMRMHQNYDYVICSGAGSVEHFMAGFGVDRSQISLIGMPRIDYILRSQKLSFRKKMMEYYKLEDDKPVILYMPTFRKGKHIPLSELTDHVPFDKYQLLVRLHPLDKTPVTDSRVVKATRFYSWDLMAGADILITDYSALSMEAALLDKRIYFWLYDEEEYNRNRGVNVDLWEAFPEYSFQNAKSLMETVEMGEYNFEYIHAYRDLYVSTGEGATQRLRELITEAGSFTLEKVDG